MTKQENKNNQNTTSKQNHRRVNTLNKKASTNVKSDEISILYILPVLFVVTILPLIVKLHQYSANFSKFSWFTENDIYFDFFLYYKQIFLIFAAVVMSVFVVYRYITDKRNISFPKIFIPLAIYALFALLSSVLSEYRSYSFTGTYEQFESVFALLSYCVIAYYSFSIIRSERSLRYVIYALLVGACLMSLIGLTQVTGHDFYNTDIGWHLISNSTYANNKTDFPITVGENIVYLSLFNPNYVGVYVSLLFPIMFYMTIFTKKIWLKLAFLIAAIGLLVCLYGSASTTGLISIILTVLFSILILWRYLLKYFYFSIPIVIFTILGIFIINSYSGNYITKQFNKLMNIQNSMPVLTEIQTNEDNLVVKYGGNTLKVVFMLDESGVCTFTFKDQDDNYVTNSMDTINGPVTITDARFEGFMFTPAINRDGTLGFDALINGKTWFFTNQYGDKTYYYVNIYGKYDKIANAPSALFTGYEAYASGRGYIWSRTIPLLTQRFLFGSGADTFTIVFPQNDYVNSRNYGFEGQIMSKPHSIYLQVGVQTGVLSLLAFLIFYGWYILSSVKIYLKCRFDSYYYIVGAALFISSIGYMFSGITNDSSITIAPIFWVIIGTGIAINNIIRKSNKNTANL